MSLMSIDLSLSSETLEGEYDYETNKVSLHLNHHYFATDLTREDLEQIMKLFPITSKWLNMLAEEERIHNEFMKKAQEIIGNSL